MKIAQNHERNVGDQKKTYLIQKQVSMEVIWEVVGGNLHLKLAFVMVILHLLLCFSLLVFTYVRECLKFTWKLLAR